MLFETTVIFACLALTYPPFLLDIFCYSKDYFTVLLSRTLPLDNELSFLCVFLLLYCPLFSLCCISELIYCFKELNCWWDLSCSLSLLWRSILGGLIYKLPSNDYLILWKRYWLVLPVVLSEFFWFLFVSLFKSCIIIFFCYWVSISCKVLAAVPVIDELMSLVLLFESFFPLIIWGSIYRD